MKPARGRCRPLAMAATAVLVAFAPFNVGLAAAKAGQDAVRTTAEDLAEAATREFSVILGRQRLAQSQSTKSDTGPALTSNDQAAGPPLSWLRRSSRDFQALMGMLAGGPQTSRPWDPVADAERKAAASLSATSKAETPQVAPTTPPPKATAVPVPSADTKKATEERRLAEARRSEPDKSADLRKSEEAKAGEARRRADTKADQEARKVAEAKRLAEGKAI